MGGWFNSGIGVAVLLLVGLLLSAEVGVRLGRRAAASGGASGAGQVGAIQGALLGLLGLLLGFSFAAAGTRFVERQDLIVSEANAIGTAFLRADLLDPADRVALQTALRDYVRDRIEISARLSGGISPDDAALIERQHAQMWNAAAKGVRARPEAIVAVVEPVNEVIDMHSTRVAAGRRHLPAVIMALLVACSMLSLGVIGYGGGLANSRRLALTASLAAVIATALWITIDLDYPRMGMLQLSDAPLRALRLEPTAP